MARSDIPASLVEATLRKLAGDPNGPEWVSAPFLREEVRDYTRTLVGGGGPLDDPGFPSAHLLGRVASRLGCEIRQRDPGRGGRRFQVFRVDDLRPPEFRARRAS